MLGFSSCHVNSVVGRGGVGQSAPVAEPDTRTGAARRAGRPVILDASATRFAEVTLDQVVGAIAGVRDVAAAAGVAPAALNLCCLPGVDRANVRLAAAALAHALLDHELADERARVARYAALAVAPRSPGAAALLRAHHESARAAAVASLEVRL